MGGDNRADYLGGDRSAHGRSHPAGVQHATRPSPERATAPGDPKPNGPESSSQQMDTHAYAPGEIILPYGVRADSLGLIIKGEVGVYSGQHEAARRVAVLLPGSTFGDMTLAGNHPNGSQLQALTRCEIRYLRRADLQALATDQRARRHAAPVRGLIAGSALVLLVCLTAAVLALSLPSVRQAVAVLPMGLGQWCSHQAERSDRLQVYDLCAERAWTVATHLAPADANPLLALGAFYFERGQTQAAEQAFKVAQALAPELAETYNNLGLVYARRGEHDQAIAAFQRAMELEPGTAAVEHNLGLSLQAVQAYGEALDHYQLALAFGEPRASTLSNMAIGYYESGQPDKAADTAWQVLGYDETSAPAHTILGAVALESQRPAAALRHLCRAIALDDSYSQAYFYLGLAHEALDQPGKAIVAIEQALAAADDSVTRDRIRQRLKELYKAEDQNRSP